MILAAVLAGAVAGATPDIPQIPPMPVPPGEIPSFGRMPNFYSQPAKCGPMADAVTRRIRTATGQKPLKIYAVDRTVGGCAVPAPMGYRPDYLLPGKADAPLAKTPAKP